MHVVSRLTATLALTALTAAAAVAAPVTYSFTGTVTSGGQIGQAVSGSFTFDPSLFNLLYGDGTTENGSYAYFSPAGQTPGGAATILQTNPSQVLGGASSGTDQVNIGGGTDFDLGWREIRRSDGISVLNRAFSVVKSVDTDSNVRTLYIGVVDFLGTKSQIFTDPNGGVNFDQGINWLATGATSSFILQDSRLGVSQMGTLTSVTVTTASAELPEPTSLALVAVALAGAAGVARRRSNATRG